MSEENCYSLLTKDEQKKLHEKVFGPITNINTCLKNLEDNKGKLLDTLEEIKLEGGAEKLIGLRNEVDFEAFQLNQLFNKSTIAPFSDSVDDAVIHQTVDKLGQLSDILKLLILSDDSEAMSSGMVNLQISHADFFVHALNKDGWIPDKVNDEDDTKITLEDLVELGGDDDATIIALEELLELLEEERDHKETNK